MSFVRVLRLGIVPVRFRFARAERLRGWELDVQAPAIDSWPSCSSRTPPAVACLRLLALSTPPGTPSREHVPSLGSYVPRGRRCAAVLTRDSWICRGELDGARSLPLHPRPPPRALSHPHTLLAMRLRDHPYWCSCGTRLGAAPRAGFFSGGVAGKPHATRSNIPRNVVTMAPPVLRSFLANGLAR